MHDWEWAFISNFLPRMKKLECYIAIRLKFHILWEVNAFLLYQAAHPFTSRVHWDYTEKCITSPAPLHPTAGVTGGGGCRDSKAEALLVTLQNCCRISLTNMLFQEVNFSTLHPSLLLLAFITSMYRSSVYIFKVTGLTACFVDLICWEKLFMS